MIIKLGFEVGVGKHFMDGLFHILCPFIESRADPFLDLDDGEAEHDPNENDSNGNFDDGSKINGILIRMKMIGNVW